MSGSTHKNPAFLQSKSTPSLSKCSPKFRFIVTLSSEKCKRVLQMLRVFINFLYFVTLDKLVFLMFRCKSTQLLDRSSFINQIHVNDDPSSNEEQLFPNQTRTIANDSIYAASARKGSFLKTKIYSAINCNEVSVRCNSAQDKIKFNNCNEFMYKAKNPSILPHNQKCTQLLSRNQTDQGEYATPKYISSLVSIKTGIPRLFPSIKLKLTNFLNQNLQLIAQQVPFYSTLYLCDTVVNFLEFYNKFSRIGVRVIDVTSNAIGVTNYEEQMEFSSGIAEINQNQSLTKRINVSKLIPSFKSLKFFWSNFTQQSFAQLHVVWRNVEPSSRVANKSETMCGQQRTREYFQRSHSTEIKCSGNVLRWKSPNEWWKPNFREVQYNCKKYVRSYHPCGGHLNQTCASRMYRVGAQNRLFGIPIRTLRQVLLIAFISTMPHITASFHHNIKYSMNVVKTKYGPLRGIVVRSNPTVEAFLGVPYASPPVGSLRYMPPVTPSTWRSTRLADRFSAVCPQVAPVAPSGPEALLEVPRGRLAQLRRLLPLLANQSEDCLYLNLYVPRALYPTPPSSAQPLSSSSSGTTSFVGDFRPTGHGLDASSSSSAGGTNSFHNIPNDAPDDKPLPAILYIHGESYEWNSGNPYDGSVLAAHGNVIVVTINFRLGVLGFLKTGGKGSAQGNFGLMDLVAGLHWLRENLPAFGGDPNRVTVMGHGTGAALANVLIVSPVASDLVHRVILLSGSALSPWAIQKDPLFVKRRVAEQTGCHGDMVVDDLAPCLRTKSISELLAIKIDSPRFLPGFAPFIDGTVIVHPSGGSTGPLTLPTGSAIASTSGIELADFPNRELIFGLTTIESYLDLSAQDLEFGFNETRRDRILRTYVRNVYHYHLNEIYAALKNEYTDWERPVRNPMGSRDASLEFLSDGHTAAPLIRLGYLHSLRGGRSYFLHFRHQSGERDFPQRGGSVRGEDVPFCLGLPISPLFPHNYTKHDVKISRVLIRYLTNFALTGNPNENPTASVDISRVVHNSKTALVSSSLTVASSLSPRSSPPSMSLVRAAEGITKSENQPAQKSRAPPNISLPAISSAPESASPLKKSSLPLPSGEPILSTIQKHVPIQQYTSSLLPHQSPSLVTSSISSSALPVSSPSSVESSRSSSISSAQSSRTLAEHHRDEQSFPSSSSASISSSPSSSSSVSSTSPLASMSHHAIDVKDAPIFLAPPAHTAIKSKRHAVAAHRRKRKTARRLPGLQSKFSSKKTNNYRKKFLASNGNGGYNRSDRVNQNFRTSSSSSFLADEGTQDRHTGRGVDPDEDNSGIEDDEDDEEETNSDEERPQPEEDNDEDDEDGNSLNSPNSNKKDDENNNSADDYENSSGGGGSETFDRFGNGHFNIPARLPFWDTYDAINQLYLDLGNKVEVKNHYRGHKLSMWLSLIPQLHSPGDLSELPMRHHHFMEDSAQYYDGIIRPQIIQRPSLPKQPVQHPSGSGSSFHRGAATRPTTTTHPKTDNPGFNVGIPATTECPPNTTIVPTIAATRPQNHQQNNNNNPSGNRGPGSNSGVISDSTSGGGNTNKQDNNLFRRLASSQFQSYTTALTVTIAVGCFLLLLNILIFAGIYYQREKRATDAKKKELLREAETLCSSTTNLEKLSAVEGTFPGGDMSKGSRKSSLQSLTGFNSSTSFGEYSCYDEKIQCKEKHSLADICAVELPLKEFKCSASPVQSNTGSLRRQTSHSNPSSSIAIYPPSYHHPSQSTPHHKSIHQYPSPDRKGCSNASELVTYEQFQKPPNHQHLHQGHSHQMHPFHNHQATGASSSATVGTSTEQCNQSTQSEQPKVQDVATSIDEKAVGGRCNSENGSEKGSSTGSGGGSVNASAGTSSSINDADNMISPGIPEPPPPPKSTVPYQGGILRQPGPPTTPSANKKRVQIQEISV